MIEIFNKKQQNFLMKAEIGEKIELYFGRHLRYPANFWLGAELWRSNWYWTRWGKKVKYVPNNRPLRKDFSQSYAYMSLTKKSVEWKADRPREHGGLRNPSTISLMPLCQISREARKRSKNLGE